MIELDLGSGYSCCSFTERDADGPTGVIVTGPAGEHCPYRDSGAAEQGLCAGGVSFESSKIAKREGRPMWKVASLEPLTLTPSIRCKCDTDHPGEGQHGFITDGRWVNAGGITA